jgi:hypothetical protein
VEPLQAAMEAIERWFHENFQGYVVTSRDILARSVILLRAHEDRPRAPRHELEVSHEALEDNPIETIVADLTRMGIANRLKEQPEVRLMYNRFRQVVETDRHS